MAWSACRIRSPRQACHDSRPTTRSIAGWISPGNRDPGDGADPGGHQKLRRKLARRSSLSRPAAHRRLLPREASCLAQHRDTHFPARRRSHPAGNALRLRYPRCCALRLRRHAPARQRRNRSDSACDVQRLRHRAGRDAQPHQRALQAGCHRRIRCRGQLRSTLPAQSHRPAGYAVGFRQRTWPAEWRRRPVHSARKRRLPGLDALTDRLATHAGAQGRAC